MDKNKDEELGYFILRKKTGIQGQKGINVVRATLVRHIDGDRAGIYRQPVLF